MCVLDTFLFYVFKHWKSKLKQITSEKRKKSSYFPRACFYFWNFLSLKNIYILQGPQNEETHPNITRYTSPQTLPHPCYAPGSPPPSGARSEPPTRFRPGPAAAASAFNVGVLIRASCVKGKVRRCSAPNPFSSIMLSFAPAPTCSAPL